MPFHIPSLFDFDSCIWVLYILFVTTVDDDVDSGGGGGGSYSFLTRIL